MSIRALIPALLALAATAFVPQVTEAAAAAPLSSARNLFVGHSLINNEVPAIVQALAESKGKTSRTAVQWYIGAPIRYNFLHCHSWQLATEFGPPAYACDEINRGTDVGAYDQLIITEGNNAIIHPSNPDYTGDTPEYFVNFLDLFLDRNGAGRAYLYTSWEDQGYEFHNGAEWTTRIAPELAKYEMIARLIEERERTTRGRNVSVPVIPVNLALRDLILAAEAGNFAGITSRSQLFTDKVHLSGLGYYLAACVVYSSIFQESPAGGTAAVREQFGSYIVNLDPDLAARIQNFAWSLVANYRGWTSTVTRPRPPTNLIVR